MRMGRESGSSPHRGEVGRGDNTFSDSFSIQEAQSATSDYTATEAESVENQATLPPDVDASTQAEQPAELSDAATEADSAEAQAEQPAELSDTATEADSAENQTMLPPDVEEPRPWKISKDADLEIILHHQSDEMYVANMRFAFPKKKVDARLTRNAVVQIDFQELLAYSFDPDTYGRLLTEMLFADVQMREAWRRVRGYIDGTETPLHIRLNIDPSAEALHTLRWETLHDPMIESPLGMSERMLFSRYLVSADLVHVPVLPKTSLKALVAVANPTDLRRFNLTPIDGDAEIQRVTNALRDIHVETLPHASMNTIAAALRDGPQILYLICHGRFIPERQDTFICLEHEDGSIHWLSGADFAQQISNLVQRPFLVVLAISQSAGQSHHDHDSVLSALGPRLIRAGVAAVVAMQGSMSIPTISMMMPIFFKELLRDGRIDRALTAARVAVRDRPDWWMPVLFMHIADGRLWKELHTDCPLPNAAALLGRESDVKRTISRLCDENSAEKSLAIYGLPGVGKTDLFRTVGCDSDITEYFEDGVLYAALGQKSDLVKTLRRWIMKLGAELPNSDDTEALADMLRSLLKDRRVLLIIDDVWDSSLIDARILRDCAEAHCRVLTSSRSGEIAREMAGDVDPQELPILDAKSALELLRQAAESKSRQRVITQEIEEAKQLVDALRRLPLVLKLAGKYLREDRTTQFPVATLLKSWQHQLGELQGYEKRPGMENVQPSLDAIIGLSYHALPDDQTRRAASALGAFGVISLDWDWGAMKAVWDKTLPTMKKWEKALVRSGLVDVIPLNRYSVHPTIGAFLGQYTKPDDRQRHANYYLKFVEQEEPKLIGPEQGEAADQLELEHANIRVALAWSIKSGTAEMALRFGGALWRFWELRGYFTEGRSWFTQILELPVADMIDTNPALMQARANALNGAGVLAKVQGDLIPSVRYLKESLSLWRSLGVQKDTASSLILYTA